MLKWKRREGDCSGSSLSGSILFLCLDSEGLVLSRLTTLWQAVGDDEGLEVEVIDVEQEVGKGEAKDAEGE